MKKTFGFVLMGVLMLAALGPVRAETGGDLVKASPILGNANGDVTIVEFFDYQCGYCKANEEAVAQLAQEDKNLKVVFMDFPKLGPLSITAAAATLASMRQGMDKYWKFHAMLMNKNVRLSGEDMIYQAAGAAGLDVSRLKQDMNDPAIAQQIQNDVAFGKGAGVRVTPSFLINGTFVPGFQYRNQLKQMVENARGQGNVGR